MAPRELPFRLLVLGDVGGDKSGPLDQRKVRQLNGRNLGEVIKGLKVAVRDIDLGDAPGAAAGAATPSTGATPGTATPGTATPSRPGATPSAKPRPKATVLIDSMSSFAPDDILKLLTGQKASAVSVDPMLANAWGSDKTAKDLWPGDELLTKRWAERELVVGFQKSYQNSKTLRAALKRFSAPPAGDAEIAARKAAIADMKTKIEAALK